MEQRPLVIVGAGPAGTATALHLQRQDASLAREILILEKARHPRPKVCAGGLIPHAVSCLRSLGLELDVPHVVVDRARVVTPHRSVLHEDRALCYVIRRNEFDASLVAACQARSVEVREEEGVVDVRREGSRVRVVTTRGDYVTPLVIAADGSGSLVRRRLVDHGKARLARAVMCDIPVAQMDWDGFAARRYEFDFRRVADGLRGYCWAFPCLIDGEPHANLGIYSMAPQGATMDAWLSEYLRSVTPCNPRRQAFPIRWYSSDTRVAAPNVLLAGDAAGADPLMGEGISLALEYGAFAASAARDALATGDLSGAAYQRAIEGSWFGRKLRRLHLATRIFYGRLWPVGFFLAERSTRMQKIGLLWYNGVDGWDRRSGWLALHAVLRNDFHPREVVSQ